MTSSASAGPTIVAAKRISRSLHLAYSSSSVSSSNISPHRCHRPLLTMTSAHTSRCHVDEAASSPTRSRSTMASGPLGAADRPGAVDPDIAWSARLVRLLGTANEPQRHRRAPAALIGLVMVNLDTIDALDTERSLGQAPSQLLRVPLADVVDMDPVAEIQRVRTPPVMQATSTHDNTVTKHPVGGIAAALPMLVRRHDESGAVFIADRFERHPRQPRAKVVQARLDRHSQVRNVVGTPQTEVQAPGDDLVRKTPHPIQTAIRHRPARTNSTSPTTPAVRPPPGLVELDSVWPCPSPT
jgi:hypothetical protein